MNVPGLSGTPPHFLLVEDNDLVAAACRRALARHGIVSVAASVAEAGLVVASVRLTGLVADVTLPDGTGFDVAHEARARAHDLPILLISGAVDPSRLVAAHQLEATYLLKPVGVEELRLFAERAVARQHRALRLLQVWVERHHLSAAETVTMRHALDGLDRHEIAAIRGVSPNTLKHQIGSLLAKLDARSLTEALALFYRELSV